MTKISKTQTKLPTLAFKPYSLLLFATVVVGLIVAFFNNPGWGVAIINLGVMVHLLRRGVLALERLVGAQPNPQTDDLEFDVLPSNPKL